MRGRHIALTGIFLGFLAMVVPYLLLRDLTGHWATYLYWALLTLAVLVVGLNRVAGWGGE